MLKTSLAAALVIGAASTASATCTLVGGPLANAMLSAPAPILGVVSGTFTSPLGNSFPGGGFTVGPAPTWEVATIDGDLGADYDVVILLHTSSGTLTTYKAWGEQTTATAFHLLGSGTVSGSISGHC